jgi:hypothetical protein
MAHRPKPPWPRRRSDWKNRAGIASFQDAPPGAGPESITTTRDCGFGARRFAMPRNDERDNFLLSIQQNNPTGKSVKTLSSPIRKNISVSIRCKSPSCPPPSRPTQRGVSRSSPDVGTGCDGRKRVLLT